jgi:hypothetical protein
MSFECDKTLKELLLKMCAADIFKVSDDHLQGCSTVS